MKPMLLTTSQMEKLHGFEQDVAELKCNNKTLESVNEFKLLGITIDKNLNWKKHLSNARKNCFATLNVLRKMKDIHYNGGREVKYDFFFQFHFLFILFYFPSFFLISYF